MLTPNETNALIRELKKNREDMLPKCKLEITSKISCIYDILGDYVDYLRNEGTWDSGYNGDLPGRIYSLPADFPEVPEVTEGWVVVPVDNGGYVWVDGRYYEWLAAPVHAKSESRRVSHFGGYLWESKIKPGRYVLSCAPHGFDSVSGLTHVPDQWVKPATPKALRFWSTDVAKACTLGFKPWNADEWPKV